MTTTSKISDVWAADESATPSVNFIRVRNTETGETGYRQLRQINGRFVAYGPVYDRPNCTTRAAMLANFDGSETLLDEYLAERPDDLPANVIG